MRLWFVYVILISLVGLPSCYRSQKKSDKPKTKTGESEHIPTKTNVTSRDKLTDVPARSGDRPNDKVDILETLPNSECTQRITSNLPGVSIHVTSNQCSFSSAEIANDYVETAYELHIEQPLVSVLPYRTKDPLEVPWPAITGSFRGGCTAPQDASGIVIAQWVAGATRDTERIGYCDCDWGNCVRPPVSPKDVKTATYKYTFRWIGQKYWGSAKHHYLDSGDPLPPGDYEIRLRTNGTYLPEGATNQQTFHVETIVPITITP